MPYKNHISGIYIITCLINGKVYVGRSVSVLSRLGGHKSKLKENKHANIYLQRAWNKYGEEKFSFELLEEWDIEFLPSMETWWINILNSTNRDSGYNLALPNHKKVGLASEETKKKMSKNSLRKPWTVEQRAKFLKSRIGKSTRNKGTKHPWTHETNIKNKLLKKLKYGNNPKAKKVINIKTKEIFSSCSEIADLMNLNYGTLRGRLNGSLINNTSFMYLENYNKLSNEEILKMIKK